MRFFPTQSRVQKVPDAKAGGDVAGQTRISMGRARLGNAGRRVLYSVVQPVCSRDLSVVVQ